MIDLLRMVADEAAGGTKECVETALFGCYSNGIWGIIGIALDVMTVLVGAGAVIGIVLSGIQYSAASGDPGTMAKAKSRIFDIIIGILAYGLFWVFLQWIIPGGALN